MTIVRTVTKNVITRAWTDIEPKLLAFLTTGLSAGVITEAANYLGFTINPALAIVIATVVASIAGYFKSSTSKVPAFAPAIVTAVPAPAVVTTAEPLPVLVPDAPVA